MGDGGAGQGRARGELPRLFSPSVLLPLLFSDFLLSPLQGSLRDINAVALKRTGKEEFKKS